MTSSRVEGRTRPRIARSSLRARRASEKVALQLGERRQDEIAEAMASQVPLPLKRKLRSRHRGIAVRQRERQYGCLGREHSVRVRSGRSCRRRGGTHNGRHRSRSRAGTSSTGRKERRFKPAEQREARSTPSATTRQAGAEVVEPRLEPLRGSFIARSRPGRLWPRRHPQMMTMDQRGRF